MNWCSKCLRFDCRSSIRWIINSDLYLMRKWTVCGVSERTERENKFIGKMSGIILWKTTRLFLRILCASHFVLLESESCCEQQHNLITSFAWPKWNVGTPWMESIVVRLSFEYKFVVIDISKHPLAASLVPESHPFTEHTTQYTINST